MPTTDLRLRPATRDDLAAVSEIHLAARAQAVPAMPPLVHTPDEVRSFHASLDLEEQTMWVAETDRVIAYSELKGDWLDDLYVHPAHQGEGIGAALLDVAKAGRPDGFCLWVFESNRGARRFYERHGLVALEATDGSGNEERAPDVRMAWPGREPLAFFRRLIDEVDDAAGRAARPPGRPHPRGPAPQARPRPRPRPRTGGRRPDGRPRPRARRGPAGPHRPRDHHRVAGRSDLSGGAVSVPPGMPGCRCALSRSPGRLP